MQEKENNYTFLHSTLIQSRFNDYDILGHVNNSVYQNYFDLARTAYFTKVFSNLVNWREDTLVLAKITIEYMNPVMMDETCEVQSKVVKLGTKSITMQQQVVNTKTGEINTKNEAIMVAFNYQKDCAVELPEQWKKDIAAFEKDIPL